MTPIMFVGSAIILLVPLVQTPIPVLIFRKTLPLGPLTSIAVETSAEFPLPAAVTRSTPAIPLAHPSLLTATFVPRFLPIPLQLHPDIPTLMSIPLAPRRAKSLTFRAVVVFRRIVDPETMLPKLVETFPPFLLISLPVDPVLSLARPPSICTPLPLLLARSVELVLVTDPREVRLDRRLVRLEAVRLTVPLTVEALIASFVEEVLVDVRLASFGALLEVLLAIKLLVVSSSQLEHLGTPGRSVPPLLQVLPVLR